jgi:uncharacterized protein
VARRMTQQSDQRKQVTKQYAAKADTTAGEGKFTALVSAFGITDSQGQSIERGAFADALKAFSDDQPLPVLWDHQWDDIWAHIGSAKAEETDEGLRIEAQLDMSNPTAEQAYSLLSQGRVHEFSIGGFESPEGIETDDQGVEHVTSFALTEVSLTLKGANPATKLIEVKHDASGPALTVKEGRVLASKHVQALKSMRDSLADDIKALDAIIEAVSPPPGKDGKNKDQASTNAEAFMLRKRRAFARINLISQMTGEEDSNE